MSKSNDCASHIHEFCNQCDCECHGENFSIDEVRTLYRLVEYQYIAYDNEAAHTVVNRISQILRDYESRKNMD